MTGGSSPDNRPDFPWRLILALGFGQILSWAVLFYAFALLAPRIIAETGWPKTLVFGGFSLALLVQGLVSPAIGRHVDRHGGRVVLVSGPIIGALGVTGLALSQHPLAFLASLTVMGVAMPVFTIPPSPRSGAAMDRARVASSRR